MCPTEGCWLPPGNFTFTTEEQDRRPSSLPAARYSMPLPVWMSSTTTLFWVVTEFEGQHRSSLSLSLKALVLEDSTLFWKETESLSLNYWPTAVLRCTLCGQMCSMGWGCCMPYWVVQVHPFGAQRLFEESLAHDLGVEKEDFLGALSRQEPCTGTIHKPKVTICVSKLKLIIVWALTPRTALVQNTC